jgi:5-methylcytosine-specific restriction endonuclease McrA
MTHSDSDRFARPCLDCGEAFKPTGAQKSRCPACSHAREKDRKRPEYRQGAYGGTYQHDRKAVLGLPCAIRGPHCTGIADTADHLRPVSQGGAGGPLVPACKACNSGRGARPFVGSIET